MKRFQSIRWRLQLWHGLLLVSILIGFGVTAYQLESGRLSRRIDEELRQLLPVLVASQRPAGGRTVSRASSVFRPKMRLFLIARVPADFIMSCGCVTVKDR